MSTSSRQFVRSVRLLKLVRLVRVARIVTVARLMCENANMSEKFSIITNLCLSIFAVIALMHLLGCSWYGLGSSVDGGWVDQGSVREQDFWTRYSMGFIWSACVFVSINLVEPLNDLERTFTIMSLVSGFVVVTIFISSFTSSLTQYGIVTNTTNVQFSVLRKYMKQHHISQRLSTRIVQNAKHVLHEKVLKTPEEDVELLKLISEPLRVDIHFEIHHAFVNSHPVFSHYCHVSFRDMQQVCHKAVSVFHFSKGDILFSPGELPMLPELLHIQSGTCNYTYDRASSHTLSNMVKNELSIGDWVNEPALWVAWVYRGLLQASQDCQIMSLNGEVLMDLCDKSHHFDIIVYGKLYVNAMNAFDAAGNVCSDLGMDVEVTSTWDTCQKLVYEAYFENARSSVTSQDCDDEGAFGSHRTRGTVFQGAVQSFAGMFRGNSMLMALPTRFRTQVGNGSQSNMSVVSSRTSDTSESRVSGASGVSEMYSSGGQRVSQETGMGSRASDGSRHS